MNDENELTLKEYYRILAAMCDILVNNPEDNTALNAFTDAAYTLGTAHCDFLFPDDLKASDVLKENAATKPCNGNVITSVKENDNNVVQ